MAKRKKTEKTASAAESLSRLKPLAGERLGPAADRRLDVLCDYIDAGDVVGRGFDSYVDRVNAGGGGDLSRPTAREVADWYAERYDDVGSDLTVEAVAAYVDQAGRDAGVDGLLDYFDDLFNEDGDDVKPSFEAVVARAAASGGRRPRPQPATLPTQATLPFEPGSNAAATKKKPGKAAKVEVEESAPDGEPAVDTAAAFEAGIKARKKAGKSKAWPPGTLVRYKAGARWRIMVVVADEGPDAERIKIADPRNPEECFTPGRSRVFLCPQARGGAAVADAPTLGEPDVSLSIDKASAKLFDKTLAAGAPAVAKGCAPGDIIGEPLATSIDDEHEVVLALINGNPDKGHGPYAWITVQDADGNVLFEHVVDERPHGKYQIMVGDEPKVLEFT